MQSSTGPLAGVDGRSREELLEEVQRLRRELQKQAEEARTVAERRTRFSRFAARVGLGIFAGSQLYQKTIEAWDAWSTWLRLGGTSPWPEAPSRDLAAALLARFTRFGLVVVVLATLPFVLALMQLVILVRQNELVAQQAELAESARRSSLIIEQSAILDRIDEELDSLSPEQRADTARPRLSPRLEGRIIALSKSLRPYRYLDGDKLTPTPLSPERGQLLLALVNSQIDLVPIIVNADFDHADLSTTRISGFNWGTADPLEVGMMTLNSANFTASTLSNGSFRSARLTRARFQNSVLSNIDFSHTMLYEADFSGASLVNVRIVDVGGVEQAVFDGTTFNGVTIAQAGESRELAVRLCKASRMVRVQMSAALFAQMSRDEECARRLRLKEEVTPLLGR